MGQLSHRVDIPFPLFDADNHLYEPPEALTKYLPKEYKDVVQYVEINGRTKIAITRSDQQLHPQPHLLGGRQAGRLGGVLQVRQPGRQEQARAVRRADEGDPGVLRARPAPRADGRAGPRPLADVPDAGQPDRGAAGRRSGRDPRPDPLAEPVAGRGLGLQLPEPHLHHPGASPCRIVDKAIEELEWAVKRGARAILVRPAPVPGFRGPRSFALPEFDPFWQQVRRIRRVRRHALVATAATRATPRSGTARRRRCCRSRPTPCRSSTSGARSRTRWPPG